ncbi:MAG: bifunctional phosphoribosyl-AMP cyclohydrolase/phosphoribosyl-ATP diphosphatase HisIE, partial [Bacilli bacterium]|nr:bifunctional phosphoribosyl-AMP cyclohydrolase/phosphoribosyl-ATP diphosphatase HisIE [Bacilli bacterium]
MVTVQDVNFDKCGGLVPCVVQDWKTRDVLMVAYMNKAALTMTINTKKATFFSRSRNELWVKGESHGTYLPVVDLKVDCDNDTLLMTVDCSINYPVCHTGQDTCFGNREFSLEHLAEFIREYPIEENSTHYTTSLLKNPIKCAQKVGEEAVETVIEACRSNKERFVYESADLLYHLLVLMRTQDVT